MMMEVMMMVVMVFGVGADRGRSGLVVVVVVRRGAAVVVARRVGRGFGGLRGDWHDGCFGRDIGHFLRKTDPLIDENFKERDVN